MDYEIRQARTPDVRAIAALVSQNVASRRLLGKAAVTLVKQAEGFTITAVHLRTQVKIPGANEAAFREAAEKAKAGCPVSKLLNAKITLDATLEAALRHAAE